LIQIFFICRGGSWLAGLAGQEYGSFTSEDEAVDRAIQSAEVCVDEGLAAKVMLEGRFGGFRSIWPGEAIAARRRRPQGAGLRVGRRLLQAFSDGLSGSSISQRNPSGRYCTSTLAWNS
jgi:hypothetical protein